MSEVDILPDTQEQNDECNYLVADDATNATSSDDSVDDNEVVRSEDVSRSNAAVTVCPSHILQDGTFVHLPLPTEFERTRFFERSVGRHGLIQEDVQASQKRSREENGDEVADKAQGDKRVKAGKEAPQIHPLALASARIQSNAINELNRAINLQSLVSTGEYFGLSNIVDPSFDRIAGKSRGSTSENDDNSSRTDNPGTFSSVLRDEAEARARALYVLQRKRDVFVQAANTLNRHRRRLIASVVSQKQIDSRWRELRPFWRLVAPEHATRALPHPVKTTEVVCADVDVYHYSGIRTGRLASRIPRFASIDLSSDYMVTQDVKDWQRKKLCTNQSSEGINSGNDDQMEIDNTSDVVNPYDTKEPTLFSESKSTETTSWRKCTKAYPYTVADPSLGNIDVDSDPSNVTMLTLQFTIEKPSSGYAESACLEPILNALADHISTTPNHDNHRDDEYLLVLLQHSLFCSKLFESMRRELAADTESLGQVRTSSTQGRQAAWITGYSDESFFPPPSMMIGANQPGLVPMCVVHIHEGDLKVLLDSEYTLNVKLVESNIHDTQRNGQERISRNARENSSTDSGSQTPRQLKLLCHALLLHAQETYHRHSTQIEAKLEHDNRVKAFPHLKTEPTTSPLSLQNCVSLGRKILFEMRIRQTLQVVKAWLQNHIKNTEENLNIEWLALPVFDVSAQFTVSFRAWYIDANIVCDELTVTTFGSSGEYRKVKFQSDKLFELYLKTCLKREILALK